MEPVKVETSDENLGLNHESSGQTDINIVSCDRNEMLDEDLGEREDECNLSEVKDGVDPPLKTIAEDEVKVEKGKDETETEAEDVYDYLKQGFTSELCKIELKNIPHFASYADLKRMVEKACNVKAHKLKIINRQPKYAYISFSSEVERDQAIEILDGHTWRGRTLKAKKALPVPDPLLVKRKSEEAEPEDPLLKKLKTNISDLNQEELSHLINDKVCPLWRTPYEEQLKIKYKKYKEFLANLKKEIFKLREVQANTLVGQYLKEAAEKNDGLICPLHEIRPSPVIHGYRNKCEFSVGPGKIVGFRLGLYKEGSTTVIHPSPNCPIVSEKMFKIISLFQEFLNKSDLKEFNNVTREGQWKQLTVRVTSLGSLVIVAVNVQDLSKDAISEIKTQLRDFFQEKQTECPIDSIFFHFFENRDKTNTGNDFELVAGEQFIKESLRDGTLKLKISPFAFFQTNTRGAEVCYESIISLAKLTEESVVLDICCGIGPIGLYLANKVRQVMGIELNSDAVRDAQYNAENNGITNAKYYEGKAEHLIEPVIEACLRDYGSNIDLVAIIDPPRAGLNSSLIKSLRATSALKRLIYVSCEPNIAKNNLIDLCRSTSNAYKGSPFIPTQAIPVDMFPHTSHCELLLLYERIDIAFNRD